MKPPTDRNHPYWEGYNQAISNVRMIFLDLSLIPDSDNLREETMQLMEHIEARCGTKVMLDALRQRNPEYRRSLLKVVK